MRKNITQGLFLALFTSGMVFGQNVGIGTATPEVRLDINGGVASKPASAAAAASITIPDNISTFYITNVAGAQANALTGPATASEGQILIINNKDDNSATFGAYTVRPSTSMGFIYLGGAWVPFAEAPGSGLHWSLFGNNITAAGTGANQNFLGTRNAQNLIMATNTVERMRILSTGNVIINNNFNDYSGTSSVLKVNGTGDDFAAIEAEHDAGFGVAGYGDLVGVVGVTTDYTPVGWTYGVWGVSDLLMNAGIGMGVVGEYLVYGAGVTGFAFYTDPANLAVPMADDMGVFGHTDTTFGGTIETAGFFHAGDSRTRALFATQSMVRNDVLGTAATPFSIAGGTSEVFRMQHNGYTTSTGAVRGAIVLMNAFATPGTQTNGTMTAGHFQVNGGTNNTGGASNKLGVFGTIGSGTLNATAANQILAYGVYGQSTYASTTAGNGNTFNGAVFGITSGNQTYSSGTGAIINTAVAGQSTAVPSGTNAFTSAVRGISTTTTGTVANITGTEGIVQAGGAWAGVFGWNTATTGTGPGVRGEANTYGVLGLGTRNPGANDEVVGVYGAAINTTALSNNNAYKFGGIFEAYDGAGSTFAYVGGYNRVGGTTTAYKILGTGTVSTIVENTQGKKVTMFAPESPEVLLQDYGKGQLVNGRAHVVVDPDFAKNITGEIRVFVQLEGDCKGVYVTNKSNTSFDVIELNGGTSNVPFTYTIVGNRADEYHGTQKITYSTLRFPDAPNRTTFQNKPDITPTPIERATAVDINQLPQPEKAITDLDRDPQKEEQIKKQKQELAKNKNFKFPIKKELKSRNQE